MGHIEDQPNAIIGTIGPAPEPPRGWDAIVASNRAEREAEDTRLASYQILVDEDE
jgi:hypothetical protein